MVTVEGKENELEEKIEYFDFVGIFPQQSVYTQYYRQYSNGGSSESVLSYLSQFLTFSHPQNKSENSLR
jgi:hypothetical protein